MCSLIVIQTNKFKHYYYYNTNPHVMIHHFVFCTGYKHLRFLTEKRKKNRKKEGLLKNLTDLGTKIHLHRPCKTNLCAELF